eukprot:150653_1
MAQFKAVRKHLKQLDIFYDLNDKKTLSDMHKASFMTYRILKGLDTCDNTLNIKITGTSHPRFGSFLLLAMLPWNPSMNDWTAKQWTYFILEVASKLKLSNDVIWIIPSYKIQPVSNNSKFSKYAKYAEGGPKLGIFSGNAADIQQDLAMRFDAKLSGKFFHSFLNMVQMNQKILQFTPLIKYPINMNINRILNALKQTVRRAYTYHDFGKIYVRDDNGKVYNGHYEYIQSRLNDAFLFNMKYKNNTEYEYEYCAQIVYDILRLDVDDKMVWGSEVLKKIPIHFPGENWIRQNTFNTYIIPRRQRTMHRKYGTFLPLECRKKCDVCGFIERYYMIERNSKVKLHFVDKIYCCPCLKFYACSRKCQKIGWSNEKFNHRQKCSRKQT